MVVYWRVEQGKVESAKSAVMAKQRAIAVTLGPQIIPFRDKIEAWVKELAEGEPKTFVRAGTSPRRALESTLGLPAARARSGEVGEGDPQGRGSIAARRLHVLPLREQGARRSDARAALSNDRGL